MPGHGVEGGGKSFPLAVDLQGETMGLNATGTWTVNFIFRLGHPGESV